MWVEFEKKTVNTVEACEETNRMIDEIEASLTKKPIQVKSQNL